MRDLAETRQIIINTYQRTHDYEMSLRIVGINDKSERMIIESDGLFWATITRIEAEFCASFTETLQELMYHGKNENVRLQAAVKLGEIWHRDKFSAQKKDEDEHTVNLQLYLPDNGRSK